MPAVVAFTFLLGWHFAHRHGWLPEPDHRYYGSHEHLVGNHYAGRFADAWRRRASAIRAFQSPRTFADRLPPSR